MKAQRRLSSGREREIAILAFHKIGAPPPSGWESWNYVPERIFASQLQFLRDGGWEWIDAAALVSAMDDPALLPRRAVLLTFDDGYRSMRTVALPILERFAAPSVLFVPTAYVGGQNTFDAGIEPDEEICDWADLRALAAAGVSIQSHSVSHPRFSELSPEHQEEEARHSKAVLEDQLGSPVELLAFPYGDDGSLDGAGNGLHHAAMAAMLARSGYRGACLYGGGPTRLPATERYRLTRIAMGPDSDLGELLRS